jgi:DNA modification methylase
MPQKPSAQPQGPRWPAHKVEQWEIGRLAPYAKNTRKHDAAQIEQIRASMRQFGWTMPVLVRESGTVITGHGRLLAGLAEGYAEVPVIVAAGWSDAQCRAYGIADNRLSETSRWDDELLKLELGDLREGGFDLGALGFDSASIGALLGTGGLTGLTDPDAVPEPPEKPTTIVGDLWVLGRHRVLCGDATSVGDVERLLSGAAIDMILTDPPYCSGGFQEVGKAAGSVGTRGTEMVANDTLSTRGYMALMKATIPAFNAGVVYVFTDWRMWINLFDVVESSGFGVRNMIVWDKGTPGMGVGWRMQHELIMCGIRVKSPFNPKKAQGNVIASKRTGNILHAVQKPVDLLTAILEVTDMAKTVADPFCGSGGTVIAAEMTGRTSFAMELMPSYTDVTIKRWQDFTGLNATLDGDGRNFDVLEEERSRGR